MAELIVTVLTQFNFTSANDRFSKIILDGVTITEWPGIVNHRCLTSVTFRNCRSLIKLPSLCELPKLATIVIENCPQLCRVPLSNAAALTVINCGRCFFPRMEALQYLYVKQCEFSVLDLSWFRSLQSLHLDDCVVNEIAFDQSIEHVHISKCPVLTKLSFPDETMLGRLSVLNCDTFRWDTFMEYEFSRLHTLCIEGNVGNLPMLSQSLTSLKLTRCQIATIPKQMCLKLTVLQVVECHTLQMPPWISELPLVSLTWSHCSLLQPLPATITSLNLDSTVFPEPFTQFDNLVDLKELSLQNCIGINRCDLRKWPQLLVINAPGCSNTIFESHGANIHTLTLDRCSRARIESMPLLRKLSIADAVLLTRFPVLSENLTTLDLSGCISLQTIPPAAFSACLKLQTVNLSRCAVLISLPASLFTLPLLQVLRLDLCRLINIIYGNMKGLVTLSAEHCTALRQCSLEGMPLLRSLNLANCRNLQTIIAGNATLEQLNLDGCSELRPTALNTSRLKQLWLGNSAIKHLSSKQQELRLTHCSTLPTPITVLVRLSCVDCDFESVPLDTCVALQYLNLVRCIKLTVISQLPATLLHLIVAQCVALKEITTLPVSLVTLNITECSQLTQIPSLEPLSQLSVLRTLGSRIKSLGPFHPLNTITSLVVAVPQLNLTGLCRLKQLRANVAHLVLTGFLKDLLSFVVSSATSLPSGLAGSTMLTEFRIDKCSCTDIPDIFAGMHQLDVVSIANCPHLLTLPQSIGRAFTLHTVHLVKCDSLRDLPSSMYDLVELTDFTCIDCDALLRPPPEYHTADGIRSYFTGAHLDNALWQDVAPLDIEQHFL